jgi:hypothetical protein
LATLEEHFPDLACVVKSWSGLQGALKAGILAICRSAPHSQCQCPEPGDKG